MKKLFKTYFKNPSLQKIDTLIRGVKIAFHFFVAQNNRQYFWLRNREYWVRQFG